MQNQRQFEITMELLDNAGTFFTASALAKEKQVSLRTIQNDIKVIRDTLSEEDSFVFETTAKGSRILIKDEAAFVQFREDFFLNQTNIAGAQEERINDLLLYLLNQYRAVSLYQLESSLFYSSSTLVNDLKRAKEILQNYNLEILRNSNRISLDGSEVNKRNCILERNLMVSNTSFIRPDHEIKTELDAIQDIVVESFVELKVEISDVDLSNLILLLYITIQRLQKGFFIQPYDLEITEKLEPESRIAETIFDKIQKRYMLRISQEEIDYLSLYFKGRGGYAEVLISEKTDALIADILEDIRNNYGFDFTNNLNLRIALALHCDPLLIRIKYNMQLDNPLQNHIRQEYPLAFDVAVFFADRLQNIYHKSITDDEIAFLAIYFYSALAEIHESGSSKKLLIVSSNRISENTLVRQTLFRWFSNQVSDMKIIHPNELEENPSILDSFDVVLTTEKGKFYENGIALYINRFPTRNDYLNVKLALEGLESTDNILSIFREDLFDVETNISKEDIVKKMCDQASGIYELEGLYEAVMDREYMRSTFFGNGFAAMHPMSPVSSDTFVSACLVKNPIEWDAEGNKVQLVLLIGIGRNNANAFRLWNYLSKLFSDRTFIKQLLKSPTYETFIKLLKNDLNADVK